MYQLIAATGVPKGINKRWADLNPLDWTVKDLYAQFRRVLLVVKIATDPVEQYLNLETLAYRYADYPKGLADMLLDNAETALPTTTEKPVLEPRFVKFVDAYRSNYVLEAWDSKYGDRIPFDDRHDAFMTRVNPPVDYEHFIKRTLVTVNGYVHAASAYGEQGVVVFDAMRSVRISGQNQVGLLYFGEIGKITTLRITDDMLINRQTQQEKDAEIVPPFKLSGYIKIGADLTDKQVLLVLGGYLIDPTMGVLRLVNDDELEIKFSNYPLLNRFFESKQFLDLTGLGLTVNQNNPDQVSVEELFSDGVLKKYLQHSQSFLVILDSKDLFTNRYPVQNIQPSTYRAFRQPVYPLVLGAGRMPEYWPRQDKSYCDQTWQLTVYDSVRNRRAYETMESRSSRSVGSAGMTRDPAVTSEAYLLEIGSDEKLPY
jgi:hypothetical protein